MEKEKLVINKDNYKGYVELYEVVRNVTSTKEQCKIAANMQKVMMILLIPFLLTAYFLPSNFIALTGLSTILIEMVVVTAFLIKLFSNQNKLIKSVKEEYPYVDISIKTSELRKSLEKAKIITYSDNYEYLNVNEYENYIKCEEIKEKYLEETKYKGYEINRMITDEELSKPKVKKLVK